MLGGFKIKNMASDGTIFRAKKGRCRICRRVRKVDEQVKEVGEVRHGYATGHIWECIDIADCERIAHKKIAANHKDKQLIEIALKIGRAKGYLYES